MDQRSSTGPTQTERSAKKINREKLLVFFFFSFFLRVFKSTNSYVLYLFSTSAMALEADISDKLNTVPRVSSALIQ